MSVVVKATQRGKKTPQHLSNCNKRHKRIIANIMTLLKNNSAITVFDQHVLCFVKRKKNKRYPVTMCKQRLFLQISEAVCVCESVCVSSFVTQR